MRNIEKMALKAKASGAAFRPHFKTHQSGEIGDWFRAQGVTAITVSSVSMAEYFALRGWDDITIAIPFNIRESENLNALAEKITVNILAEDAGVISSIDQSLSNRAGLFLKIDCGYHRTGIDVDNSFEISKALDAAKDCSNLEFKGFLTHSGHTYHAGSVNAIRKIHQNVLTKMKRLKQRWSITFPQAIISLGDTPSMSVVDDFTGIDEIRPGNFVFYDLMQAAAGVCTDKDIAVAVTAPVIGKYPDRKQVVVHCGGVHLSKEAVEINGKKVFGKIVFLNESGWEIPKNDIFVTSLSQEHGTIDIPINTLKEIKYGDLLGILPVHSCMTADCFQRYVSVDGQMIERL
jgi:D-serine deaminase-like pyridoxal phosphate-dependent protein